MFTQAYSHLVLEDKILIARAGDGTLSLYLDGKGIDEHLGRISSREKTVYVTDHLGSVLNSPLGGEYRAYGPYGTSTWLGKVLSRVRREDPVMYGFTGRQFDPESGLYYFRARMFEPGIGRFTSKDPIGFGGGDANLYSYTRQNPLTFSDPSGLIVIDYTGITQTSSFRSSEQARRIFSFLDALPILITLDFAMVSGDAAYTSQVDWNEISINIDRSQIRPGDLARTAFHELFHAMQFALNVPLNEAEAQFHEEEAFGRRQRNQCGGL